MSDVNKKIFPSEIVEYSVEKHFSEYNPKSRVLYILVLALFFLFLILLFVIKVDVTVRSTGIIRPLQQRTDIRSAVDGIIDTIFVNENSHVTAGQILFKVKSASVDEKGQALITAHKELLAEVSDLKKLTGAMSGHLESSLYAQQYSLYRQKLNDAQIQLSSAERNYTRYASLYQSKVVSSQEFEKYTLDKRNAETQVSIIKETQHSQWQADLAGLQRQLDQAGADVTSMAEQKDLHTIKAQVSGTIQGLKGIQKGSFVSPADVLGEISPDSGLIAEAYIASKDIGMIRANNPVRLMIDAFDYNTWGMLTGKVVSISSDIYTDAQQPYFKVRCKLDKNSLSLRNGYTSSIKKGMTIQARFLITRRSLFQLLYDQTDDWLNPNLVKDAPKN